ncbi:MULTISPECIES: DUF3325 domain-containing protein [unclassified Pseudoalteromonas]|uniref:DUF3325 domain-containing protein n=1 Tax=unclassified Pseudoalteromonas TaxID=194690 RepID=UPI0020985CBF|nr:DUF3325 domain-containing protein [Pseudoalteromonas sp. XMcav2-N]MCO7187541.1 DUF3325 domain-containing protein [Pseudoalteromonas sp. XMcav2-N]
MMYLIATLLCFTSFMAFALAKTPHYKAVFGTRPEHALSQRYLVAAWIMLLLTLVIDVSQAVGYGSLMFCGQMALSVLLLATLLSFRPNWMRSLFYLLPAALFLITVSHVA